MLSSECKQEASGDAANRTLNRIEVFPALFRPSMTSRISILGPMCTRLSLVKVTGTLGSQLALMLVEAISSWNCAWGSLAASMSLQMSLLQKISTLLLVSQKSLHLITDAFITCSTECTQLVSEILKGNGILHKLTKTDQNFKVSLKNQTFLSFEYLGINILTFHSVSYLCSSMKLFYHLSARSSIQFDNFQSICTFRN